MDKLQYMLSDFFKNNSYFKETNLLDNIVLKDLKISAIPAYEIYPLYLTALLKFLGLNAILFLLNFIFSISDEVSNFLMFGKCFDYFFGSCVFIIGGCVAMWRYHWFKFAVAVNLPNGNRICQILRSYGFIIIFTWVTVQVLLMLFIKTSSMLSVASFFSSFALLFVFCAFFSMEFDRLGLKILFDAISSLLGKNNTNTVNKI